MRYYRGVHGVRLTDIVWPAHWSRVKAAQGHQLIVDATNLIQRSQPREALLFLRQGLAKSPSHRAGRLLLARLELENRLPAAALKTLLDGVDYHAGDVVYLRPMLSFLLDYHHDNHVVAIARRLLASPRGTAERNRLLAFAAATASFHRANYDQAEEFLRAAPLLDTSTDGRLLAAKIDWERGYRDIALIRLRSLGDTWPNEARIHQELMTHLQQAGATDEARRRNLVFQLAHPTLPTARMASLRFYHAAGETDRVTAEIETLLRDFPDASVLLALADFAAQAANVPLTRRLQAEAEQRGFSLEPHAFLAVEAQLAAREYRPAIETLRQMRENPHWTQRYSALFDSLQAVAHQGLGELDTARNFLHKFLLQPSPRAENLLALANRFVALDASEHAHQILQHAVAAEPANQAALTRLIELQLILNRIDELPGHLRRLLTMRKPSPDLLRVAHHKLGSDLFLFSPERSITLDAIRAALDKNNAFRPRS